MSLLIALVLGCGGGPSGDDLVLELCGNGADDDENGLTDCADAACADICPELCDNEIDDNADGFTDCEDVACDGSCLEVCDDTRDNDGDGSIDCNDSDCVVASCPEVCNDGRDNDNDGASDCSDTDCNDVSCDELCTDARDNDDDGAADCEDPDCDGLCPESCFDGRDNDLDGFSDCDDPQCEADCPEDCLNFVDDDADALVDCVDPECADSCDYDNDGFLNQDHGGDDCNDLVPTVNPDAQEVCSGLDDDCDTLVDELDPSNDPSTLVAYYTDGDGDGVGKHGGLPVWACAPPPGMAAGDNDCNDADPTISPGETEICDGVDNDCDGLLDDDDPSVDLSTASDWYSDADEDGYGDPYGLGIFSCSLPAAGYANNGDDCDDTDPLLWDGTEWFLDGDSDGYGGGLPDLVVGCVSPGPEFVSGEAGVDCNDGDGSIHPGAIDICENLIDEDCQFGDQPCFVGELGPDFSADGWHQCAGYYDTAGGPADIPLKWAPECREAADDQTKMVCGKSLFNYRWIDINHNPWRDGLPAYPTMGWIVGDNFGGAHANQIYANGNHPDVGVSWWGTGDGCNEFVGSTTMNNGCAWEAANCFGAGLTGDRYLWVYAKP